MSRGLPNYTDSCSSAPTPGRPSSAWKTALCKVLSIHWSRRASSCVFSQACSDVVVINVNTCASTSALLQLKAQSSNIDALAAVGSRLARASIRGLVTLSGYTPPFPAPTHGDIHDSSANKLNPAQPTLASLLQAQG
jgi:hypothetical protein